MTGGQSGMMSFLGNVLIPSIAQPSCTCMLIETVFNKMFVCLILSLWLFTLQFTQTADVNSVYSDHCKKWNVHYYMIHGPVWDRHHDQLVQRFHR